MNPLKRIGCIAAILGAFIMSSTASAQDKPVGADNFYTSDKVASQKVSFPNQYTMQVYS